MQNDRGAFVAGYGSGFPGEFDPKIAEAMAFREALPWVKKKDLVNVALEKPFRCCNQQNRFGLQSCYYMLGQQVSLLVTSPIAVASPFEPIDIYTICIMLSRRRKAWKKNYLYHLFHFLYFVFSISFMSCSQFQFLVQFTLSTLSLSYHLSDIYKIMNFHGYSQILDNSYVPSPSSDFKELTNPQVGYRCLGMRNGM